MYFYYIRLSEQILLLFGHQTMNYPQLKKNVFPEMNLEELFEHIPDIYYFVKNSSYQLVMANTANVELLGCSSLEELCGKTVFDIFPEKNRERLLTP